MTFSLLLFALLMPGEAAATPARPMVAFHHSIVIKVADRDAAADQAQGLAEAAGGYLLQRSNEQVRLKVPVEKVKALMPGLKAIGTVIEENTNSQDLGDALDQLRTRLGSREQMLQRYFAVLKTAGPGSVVEVEQQMTNLVQEIETIKGNLQLYEHQLRFADITVSFEFRDRRPPVREGLSSFAWINTVNLADLLEEFSHD